MTTQREVYIMGKTKVSVEENKIDWLEKNGFDMNGNTYIYFPNDSYDKKEELKNAGFRFQKELLWHAAVIPAGYEESCIQILFAEIGVMTAWGKGMFKPEVLQLVKKKLEAARPHVISESEWFGEEGVRFYDHPVTLVSVREISTKYGDTQLVTFVDTDKNEFNWWTKVQINLDEKDKVLLTATVKKHDIYNDNKITVINRAKMQLLD